MRHLHSTTHKGMTLIEVLFAIAILGLVFGGLLASLHVVVTLIGSSKAHAGALALANEKLEYIRSLAYDDIGTISGIPNGPIPQTSTTSLNGVTYTERVLIEYIDDEQDGEGASDENAIVADYKLVKVEYSWSDKGTPKTISLISNMIPRGIETTAGGGTLVVNVFDASALPVSGASVRVYNNTGTTTIDTTRNTNVNGIAMFSGAPALANYQITVTDTGFSTDQTYTASTTNPNPLTPHVAVLEAEVSTMNFQIDELSDLIVQTWGLPTDNFFEDEFDDTSLVATSSGVVVASGLVALTETAGVYNSAGTLLSSSVNLAVLDSWNVLSYAGNIPNNTSLLVSVYDTTGTTTPTLIPDASLPGNSVGFAPGNIILSSLDPSVYQELVLKATFGTSDTATTSALLSWNITYTESQTAIANVPFTLTSAKVIGTTASATAVYKYQRSMSTDGSGDITIPSLEWDVYTVVVDDASYDVAEACANIPYSLAPGVNDTLKLTLAPSVAYSLRVVTQDSNGDPIPNVDIELSRSGFSADQTTTTCGQTFFNSGLISAVDYALTAQAFGYDTQTISDITVDGTETLIVTLANS